MLVGWEIGRSRLDPKDIVEWLIERRQTVGWQPIDPVLRGLLHGMNAEKCNATIDLILKRLQEQGKASAIPDLLISAPFTPASWKLLESMDPELREKYWTTVIPGVNRLDPADINTAIEQLCQRGRARSAFQLLQHEPDKVGPTVLKSVLDAIRSGTAPDGPLPDGWHIGEAIKALAESGQVSRRDLAMLEFAFFRALEHTEHGTSNLYAELLSDPSLFMECICLVYKPQNGTPETGSDAAEAAAEVAWHVLHSGRGIPGQSTDGSIDSRKFMGWMAAVRSLAEERDKLAVTDLTVGEWLSQCRSDSDGTWPPSAIATLLDDEQHEDIRRGFSTGVFNNRGVTSRAMNLFSAVDRPRLGVNVDLARV
jgi:hypothetical protein